jgi:LPXTG-site transpeptidase (sortase) family protein
MVRGILQALTELFSSNWLALAVGLILGISTLLLIRAGQVWRHRQVFGYSVYTADSIRKRLLRWSAAGVFIALGVGLAYLLLPQQSLFAPPVAEAEPTPVNPLEGMRLVIPKLAVEAPLIEAPFVAQQWDISRLTNEVAHLAGTAYPGQPGNAVLAGHITIPGGGWGPFQELDQLEAGDRVFIEQGRLTWVYEVTERRIVEPGDVEVAFPTNDTRLTLLTCAGWSDILDSYAQRIVVIALLVQ